jgi:hypothetical protein
MDKDIKSLIMKALFKERREWRDRELECYHHYNGRTMSPEDVFKNQFNLIERAIEYIQYGDMSETDKLEHQIIDKIDTELYPYQRELISKLARNDRVKVNWVRQTGKTETLAWYAASIAQVQKCNIHISSCNVKMSEVLIDKIYNCLPDDVRCGRDRNTVCLANGSRITSNNVQWEHNHNSRYKNIIIADEYGNMGACETPSWSVADQVVCVSRNLNANAVGQNFKEHRVHWYDIPGTDLEWKYKQVKLIGPESWEREYEVD